MSQTKVVTVDSTIPAGKAPVADGSGGYTWQDSAAGVKFQTFTRPGSLVTETGVARLTFPAAATITSVRATVNTAPTGASVIVDVLKNGATIWGSNPGNRPTIAAAGNQSGNAVPDTTALAAGDYLQVQIAQVGSTITGADLTVTVQYS